MIRLHDAGMLALTKLRTRKVRLIVTIVVSGLLFSALAGASLVARGVMGSMSSFSKEGLGDRYIIQAYPQSFSFFDSPEIIDRALAIQTDIVARKKVEAKRLGLNYDTSSERLPVQEYDYGGGKQRSLDISHPAAEQAAREFVAAQSIPGRAMLTTLAKPYQSVGIYSSRMLPFDQKGTQLQVLKDGKETYGEASQGKAGGPPTGTDSFISSWSVMSNDLLEPFILSGQNLTTGADGSSPIIVPRQAAEQLLGLKELPPSATPKDRLERTREMREKAPGIRFSVCYRNTASANLVDQAVSAKKEMEDNKNKPGYQKPDLVYGLPVEPCAATPITRDVRSQAQKTADDKERQFNELFGAVPPAQSTMTFRIVGIVPDVEYGGAFGVAEIIRSLVTSSLGSGWYSPMEQLDSNSLMATLFSQTNIYSSETYYAEFSTASAARSFVEKENCVLDYDESGPDKAQLTACLAKNRGFGIGPYGSNSLALESAKRGFGKFFAIAALAVSAIACIIMMGTVGRMIADSRRETAVFRAIGAKKLDIAQIYTIYVICLSLLISIFALVIGLVLALLADHRWSADATVQAITAYNSQNLDKTFSLYGFYVPDILLLVGLALAAGLLSAVLPLFRNLRRNPIRDMRDDT